MKLIFLIFLFAFIGACASDDSKSSEKSGHCYDCQYWQYCNDIQACVLNKNDGYCNTSNDCSEEKYCKTEIHECVPKKYCSDCKEWETCNENSGICELEEYRCYLSYNCDEDNNQYCDLVTHRCEYLDDICDLDCMSWEDCIINEDNEKKCIVKATLKWDKLDIDGIEDSSLFTPFDLGSYGYNPKENTLINYYTKDENYNSKIGKLNLNTNIQTEEKLDLMNNQTINGFCDNRIKDCQLISFNKSSDKEKFMIVSLSSASILYIDDKNITEKVEMLNKPPLDINDPVTYFNNDGNTLFVYNNKYEKKNKSKIYSFNDIDFTWKLIIENIPNILGGCLVSDNKLLYSFGGITNNEASGNDSGLNVLSIDYNTGILEEITPPDSLKERVNLSCTYDEKRDRIFIYGGAKIVDEKDELNNTYYNDLWSFDPKTKEWKLILKNIESGSYLPINETGNRIYDADITKPNFGKNLGKMIYDKDRDRLMIIGKIPFSKGIQIYTIKL